MRRGFTIIEIVVVIVILGIAAGFVLPRVVGGSSRSVRAKADEVGSVLSALARRDAMLSQPVALDYSRETGVLRVLTLRSDGSTRAWASDRLLPAAEIDGSADAGVRLVSVRSDQTVYRDEDFRIELDQFQPRGVLEVVLSDGRGKFFASVLLGATSLQASVSEAEGSAPESMSNLPEAIDLDASGKEGEAW
jgi:prepilin-type N-terminal cleavage/methylation domain-containing protein